MLTPLPKFLRCADPAPDAAGGVWVLHTHFPRFLAQVLAATPGQRPVVLVLDVFDQPARDQPMIGESNVRLLGAAPRTVSAAEAMLLVEAERPALHEWVAANVGEVAPVAMGTGRKVVLPEDDPE